MIDLAGRVIAITGASSGIGRATAIACAEAGMSVAIMARRADKLRAVANEIPEGRSLIFAGSVEDADACCAFLDETERTLGPPFTVFANAGYGVESDTLEMSDDDVRRMFEVNLFGSVNILRPALDGMIERGEGHAVMCSSCLSKLGMPRYAAYSASKAAQDHFGRALRHELGPRGVRVSTVHPIGTKTEFFEKAAERSKDGLTLMDRSKEAFMQPPEKVARAIVKRLKKDRGGEIWTSVSTRTLLGFATFAPGLTDFALRQMVRSRMKSHR
ncbi:MAG: SDR family oxidoreductase [Planctomycetota bacterium]